MEIEIYDREAKRFYEHIIDIQNHRIIFSAPYGYGKTTFLKQVSKKENSIREFQKNQFNFFHLYPVNYSVASNEDIFQYIKYDIIYSLIEKGIPLTSKDFSVSKGLKKYLKTHAHIVASKLLLLVPKVGKDLLDIFDELNKIKDEIIDACEGESVGEEDTFSEYMTELQSQNGSIYELDIFTKTIQNVLQRIKTGEDNVQNKQNVLVIDDLDRIDPAHIFRILNVFSAHLDTDNEKNKFGFDKVVLVCDLENIRKIFSHIYGQSVDFNGYIDKFYSTTVFEFANAKLIEDILVKQIQSNNKNGYTLNVEDYRIIASILTTLILNGKLNLRRINHIININVDYKISHLNRVSNSEMRETSLFEVSIYLIEVFGSYENLITVIEELADQYEVKKAVKDSIHDMNHFYLVYILPILVLEKTAINENATFYYDYHGASLALIWKRKVRTPYLELAKSTSEYTHIQVKYMWLDFLSALKTLHQHHLI